MNRMTKVAGVAALTAGVALGASLPADANVGGRDYRDCTRSEYRAVHKGDTLASVQRKLDGPGKVQFRSGSYQSRQWGSGLWNGWCVIDFQGGRVYYKGYIA